VKIFIDFYIHGGQWMKLTFIVYLSVVDDLIDLNSEEREILISIDETIYYNGLFWERFIKGISNKQKNI